MSNGDDLIIFSFRAKPENGRSGGAYAVRSLM